MFTQKWKPFHIIHILRNMEQEQDLKGSSDAYFPQVDMIL